MLIYCKKRKSYKARLNHQKNEKLQKDLLYYYHYMIKSPKVPSSRYFW